MKPLKLCLRSCHIRIKRAKPVLHAQIREWQHVSELGIRVNAILSPQYCKKVLNLEITAMSYITLFYIQ